MLKFAKNGTILTIAKSEQFSCKIAKLEQFKLALMITYNPYSYFNSGGNTPEVNQLYKNAELDLNASYKQDDTNIVKALKCDNVLPSSSFADNSPVVSANPPVNSPVVSANPPVNSPVVSANPLIQMAPSTILPFLLPNHAVDEQKEGLGSTGIAGIVVVCVFVLILIIVSVIVMKSKYENKAPARPRRNKTDINMSDLYSYY